VLTLKREEAKKAGALRGAGLSCPSRRRNLGSAGRSFEQLVFRCRVSRERSRSCGSATETLWAGFEEEAVAALGADDAAGTRGGFDDLGVDSRTCGGRVSEGEAGDAAADDEDWNVSGHEVREPIVSS